MTQMAGLRILLLVGFLLCDVSAADEEVPNPLRFLWNYADGGCHKKGIYFNVGKYGIEANENKNFLGEKIALLYCGRYGKWPFIDAKGVSINGGLPQNGDLQAHLKALETELKKLDLGDGPGLGVFDMELWRPSLDRNFGRYSMYPLLSLEQVKAEFPNLSEEELAEKNEEIWSKVTRRYVEDSLKVMKRVWPNKKWGYYAYPEYSARLRNDRLPWLWKATDAFYPSLYIKSFKKGVEDTKTEIGDKLEEAFRMRQLVGRPEIPIYAFVWVESTALGKFYGDWLDVALRVPAEMGVDGIILWATYKVFGEPTEINCEKQEVYLKYTLGPKVAKTLERMKLCSAKLCGGRGRCVDKEYAELNKYVKVRYPPKVESPISTVAISSAKNEFMKGYVCQCYEGWMGERCEGRYQ